MLERALKELFKKGKISRSEKLIKIENYSISLYARLKISKPVNVYFYAPPEIA